jgi:hypothetical protein
MEVEGAGTLTGAPRQPVFPVGVTLVELLLVIAAVLLLMRFVGLAVLILADRDYPPPRPVHPRVDPCLATVLGLPPVRRTPPEPGLTDEETVLLAHLRAGELSRDQYRAAMAELARRDTHPVR